MDAKIKDERTDLQLSWGALPRAFRIAIYLVLSSLISTFGTLALCAVLGGMPWALWQFSENMILAALTSLVLLVILCFKKRKLVAWGIAGIWVAFTGVLVLPTAKWEHFGGWWPVIAQPAANIIVGWLLLELCLKRFEPQES